MGMKLEGSGKKDVVCYVTVTSSEYDLSQNFGLREAKGLTPDFPNRNKQY